MKKIRRYSELILLPSFEDRFEYLRLGGIVGESTFGFDRFLNQAFYKTKEWHDVRNSVIIRDEGSDMGIADFPIVKGLIVHHMNPITEEDLDKRNPDILDPEFLICVSQRTHNAIHYGDSSILLKQTEDRSPFDTCPWR